MTQAEASRTWSKGLHRVLCSWAHHEEHSGEAMVRHQQQNFIFRMIPVQRQLMVCSGCHSLNTGLDAHKQLPRAHGIDCFAKSGSRSHYLHCNCGILQSIYFCLIVYSSVPEFSHPIAMWGVEHKRFNRQKSLARSPRWWLLSAWKLSVSAS